MSRDSLSHHELWAPGGDSATKAEGAVLQVRRAPLGTCVPASSANLGRGEAGVCPSTMALLHPSYCRWLRANLEPGKKEDRSGMCCGAPATYPLPPPSSGQGRSSCASAPTLHTKQTKEVMSQQSLLTRWDKASPGGSRSHLTGFRGEKCTPHYGWTWPAECTNSTIHPTKPNTDSLTPQTPVTSKSLRQGTARKRFQKASALLKRQLRKGWFVQICTG